MKSQIKNQTKALNSKRGTTSGISLGLAILFTLASLSFSSCRKKEKEIEEEDTEQNTAADNNVAESYMADIESMGSQVSENGDLSTYKTTGESGAEALEASGCATVSVSGQIVTIDFGTVACVGKDGRTRSGKLIYDFSGSAPASATRYRNPGFKMNVTSQNYVVDNYSVNIVNKTVTNITSGFIPVTVNPGTNLRWTIVANVSIVKPNNAGTITWSCNRSKELVNTSDTNCYKGQSRPIVWTKAIVKLNGSASGVNARSENFTALATNLVRDFNCAPDPVLRPHRHPFISGTIAYTPGSRLLRTIDYGNGACDLAATLTIKNRVVTITLP